MFLSLIGKPGRSLCSWIYIYFVKYVNIFTFSGFPPFSVFPLDKQHCAVFGNVISSLVVLLTMV